MKVYTIRAFAKTREGGNPAGVVLHADDLTENEMMRIAKKIGFSETAFVMKSTCADFKVRFFTPVDEVDLCGHATIGTFSVMVKEKVIAPGCYTQETKAGILEVKVKADETVMMTQSKPIFSDKLDPKEIADSLNITVEDLDEMLPCQIVSTGLRDILVPIKNRKTLDGVCPNFNRVKEISEKNKVVGYHLFTLDAPDRAKAYCRNLAPLYGINEESATGTSSGALACYLQHYHQMESWEWENLIFDQGYAMEMPSEIIVKLTVKSDMIDKVEVGGKSKGLTLTDMEVF